MQTLKSKDKITSLQLFFLTFAYLYSGTLLYNQAFRAQREAWLAALTASLLGILLLFLFVRINIACEEKKCYGFSNSLRFAFGKRIGFFFIFVYFLFFLLLHSINLAEFGKFWHTVGIPAVPAWIFAFLLLLLCAYACQKGLTVIGRLSEILAVLLPPIFFILIFSNDYVRNLPAFLPLFEQGVAPYLTGTFAAILTPFGDAVVFLTIFCEVISKASHEATPAANAISYASEDNFPTIDTVKKHKFSKTLAFLGGGVAAAIVFVLTTIRDVTAIGSHLLQWLQYPSDFSAQLIPSLNIEPLLDINLSAAYAIKNILLLYATLLLLKDLFPSKRPIVRICIMTFVISGLTALTSHFLLPIQQFIEQSPLWIVLVFLEVIFPILLYLLIRLKKHRL